jgi:hypothetical protein
LWFHKLAGSHFAVAGQKVVKMHATSTAWFTERMAVPRSRAQKTQHHFSNLNDSAMNFAKLTL